MDASPQSSPASGLSLGKRRRLQQAASARGTFTILAIDHRGPLRRALAKQVDPVRVEAALAELKRDIVASLAPQSTGVLLDPQVGLGPCIASGALPGSIGLLVALDTGSTGDPAVLRSELAPDWNVEKTVAAGAAGAKLLVYYHPEAADACAVEQRVKAVGEGCVRVELPFYLEPLSYSPRQPGLSLTSVERRRVVMATARQLTQPGVDVLKAEFPVNVADEPNEQVWRRACEELTQACPVPWALLSSGVAFEVFLRQARIACEAGASGVIAGRAVWNEAVTTDPLARRRFLQGPARERMERLREVCEQFGRAALR